MKNLKRLIISTTALTVLSALVVVPVGATEGSTSTGNGDYTSSTNYQKPPSTDPTGDMQKLTNVRQRGEDEIARRQSNLNELIARINATTRLTASDKAVLIAEVNAQITSLSTIKTTINSDSSFTEAKGDAQKIISNYRLYAFIFPKVQLIVAADRQQVTEAKLSTLAINLQSAINTATAAKQDTSTLQSQLNDMIAKNTAAQVISSKVEISVLALQPTDHNSDHDKLKAYRDQLKTAHTDIMSATFDAKNIISALKEL